MLIVKIIILPTYYNIDIYRIQTLIMISRIRCKKMKNVENHVITR